MLKVNENPKTKRPEIVFHGTRCSNAIAHAPDNKKILNILRHFICKKEITAEEYSELYDCIYMLEQWQSYLDMEKKS